MAAKSSSASSATSNLSTGSMNIKRGAVEPNRLRIPIYSMESYQDFLYFGGGGGYEIKNQIVGYQYEPGKKIVTKIIHEELTGDGVANFLMIPKDVSGAEKVAALIFSVYCVLGNKFIGREC